MPRFLGFLLAFACGCPLASAQHLVFTMRTHPACPVLISSVVSSKDFGFQSLSVLDDSGRGVASVRLTVVLSTGLDEEVVDVGRAFVDLEPGERKAVNVFLGQRQALIGRAKELHLSVARAIVFVDSVEFADGTRWAPEEPVVEIPVQPRMTR